MPNVDNALSKLGGYGCWQMIHYTAWSISSNMVFAFQWMGIVFFGGVPEHYCHVPENITATRIGSCQLFVNATNETTTCIYGWEYPDKDFGNTIVSEWDLVCERNFYAELSQTVYVLGTMLGSACVSPLADRFGRRPVHLISLILLAIFAASVAAVDSYPAFLTMRTISGILLPGVAWTGIIASCEIFPARQRTFAGQFIYFWWVVVLFVLGGLAYGIREWRNLQLTLSLLPLVCLSGYWLCPESIPWLVTNNKISKAEKIIHRAARINKVDIPDHPFEMDDDTGISLTDTTGNDVSSQDPVKYAPENDLDMSPLPSAAVDLDKNNLGKCKQDGKVSLKISRKKIKRVFKPKHNAGVERKEKGDYIFSALKHKLIMKNLAILLVLWFVNSLVYGGLALSSTSLAGNRFVNFFLQALVEIPAVFLCVYLLQRLGRRLPICIFHIITGVALCVMAFVPLTADDGTNLLPLVVFLSLVGKFAVTFTFNALIMYSLELFPTNARNTALGITSSAGRISGAIAPYSTLLMRTIYWLPGVLFGILSIAAGILTLLLPESVNRPLPDTAEEIEQWHKEQPICPCLKPNSTGKSRTYGKAFDEDPSI